MAQHLYNSHHEMIIDLAIADRNLFEQIEEIKTLYQSDTRAWVIGFSGGKDSSVVLSLVYQALKQLDKDKLTKPVYVICSDTLVETPVVVGLIKKVLNDVEHAAKRDGIPLTAHLVVPDVKNTFWANLLGKGYPAPTKSFRWCTERMKIRPVTEFINETATKFGEAIVVLGSRKEESAARSASIEKHKIDDSLLSRHSNLPNAYTYMPIQNWTADDVWQYLLSAPSPWGEDHDQLFAMYKDSNQGECPLVVDSKSQSCGNSRFGCWTCTVVTKDRALHGLIDSGEEWMRPLLNFRDELYNSSQPENKEKYRNFRRRTGNIDIQTKYEPGVGRTNEVDVNEDGSVKYVPGPYWMQYRQKWLKELLEIEKNIRDQGIDIELITRDELKAIRQEWLNDPVETDIADSLPGIYRSVYPDDEIMWHKNDLGLDDTSVLGTLTKVSKNHNLSLELLKKTIGIEIEASGGNRRGIYQKLEKLYSQDWGEKEDVLERIHQEKNELNLFKDKRDGFKLMLESMKK